MQARQLNYLVVFIVCIGLESASDVKPSVTVAQGKLAGSWMKTRGGRTVAAFRGVPYAAPPIGELRFKVAIVFCHDYILTCCPVS